MRRGLRRDVNQTAVSRTLPAPVGGLNDRDSLANMPKLDAVILENWWPQPSKLTVREGYQPWATGFPGAVETLVEYCPTSGLNRLYAASGGGIYDITANGPVGDPEVSGLAKNRWNHVSATTPGGSYLYLFNGQDKPLLFDGTDWKHIDETSTPAITGLPTTSISSGCVFKNRIFLVQNGSLMLWYLPALSIGGEAKPIDMGTIFRRGGRIVSMQTWTLDAGDGADDFAVILSSEGEVAVYSGTDPDDIASWNLTGVYFIGRPIGDRPATKIGGDLGYICETGVVPISKALLSSSVSRAAAITDKIQNSVNRAITSYGLNFGWELCVHPVQNALILNVPAGGGINYQYVQNTLTGAWTKFTGWDARTFVDTALGLFFGDSNSVKRAWYGNIDGDKMIVADALQSFQDFGQPATNKYFTLVRPFIQSDGNPSILYGINGDYVQQEPTGALSYSAPGGMIWGQMVWGEMVWGGAIRALSGWNTVGGVYSSAALRLKVQSNLSNTEWASTNFVFQRAGIV